MQPAIEKQMEQLDIATKLVSTAFSAIDTVKCFNGQDHELWQYAETIKKAARYYMSQARANALQIGFVRFMMLSLFVQGFWYGSHLVADGKKTSGQILTAFWACLMATQTFEQILPQMIVLEKGRAAAATLEALFKKVGQGENIVVMTGGKSPNYCEGDIHVRNASFEHSPPSHPLTLSLQVSFAYPSRPNKLVLNDATLFFPAGDMTFVIGTSGSGKSTLSNLLLQFYPIGSGTIQVDGKHIQDLDTNWLRNNITLVQQQSVLFNETIFKNIAFGCKEHNTVRKTEMKSCLEVAALEETVMDLPQGLDTLVGASGNAMSGGQRQRVAIARACLRNTPILILDEATSALDQTNRTHVMDAIRKWRQGKTTIVITHDISQIHDGDYLYLLEQGHVVQEGYRNALEKCSTGPFATLLNPGAEPSRPLERSDSSQGPMDHDSGSLMTSSPASLLFDNPLLINLSRRRSIIPSAYLRAEQRTSTQPQNPSASLAPVAAHLPRMTNARMSMLPLRNYNRQSEVPISHFKSGNVEFEMMTPILQEPSLALASPSLTSPTLTNPTFPPPVPPKDFPQRARSRVSYHRAISDIERNSRRVSRSLNPKKSRKRHDPANDTLTLTAILKTVWPKLAPTHRARMLLGFLATLVHAAATPVFAWVFAKLLGTFLMPPGSARSRESLTWSLAVLGVAVIDSAASFLAHLLLEGAAQAWVDGLRAAAVQRVLAQPRDWFDAPRHGAEALAGHLDRGAEEMRNLVGRFAGFVLVAAVMMAVAVAWCLVVCWKLTLVGLACGPVLYGITRGFEAMSGRWERMSNEAGEVAGGIFTETFSNIRTVRALTLEAYFHRKYARATAMALTVGLRRAVYSGVFFGLSDAGVPFVVGKSSG